MRTTLVREQVMKKVSLFWLMALMSLLLMVACGSDEEAGILNQGTNGTNGTNGDDPQRPDDPEEVCQMACDRIYDDSVDGGCQQAMLHESGTAMNRSTCVDLCVNDDLMRQGQWCIATEAECALPEQMIDACLPEGYHPPACDHLGAWDPNWEQTELDSLEVLNDLRAQGATCPETGTVMPPTGPLEMNPELRCASRLHSKDMYDKGYFAHDNQEGLDPYQRMENAGYTGIPAGENIAQGPTTGSGVIDLWFTSETGHCENMLSDSHVHIGVGRYRGHWTQKFGR